MTRGDTPAQIAAAFRRYATEVPRLVDEASDTIATRSAAAVGAAGRGSSRQAARVAGTARARRGRDAAVIVGGPGRIAGMVYGAEYGGRRRRTTQQFRPFRSAGYWYTPTIARSEPERLALYVAALDTAAARWGH